MIVDVLFPTWNRRAMAETAFECLAENTNWELVNRLVVYDDGSTDGTREWVEQRGRDLPVPAFEIRHGGFHSPPTTMNDYLATSDADVFAKVDSDIAVPPMWLDRMLDVLARNRSLELLGMAAAFTGPPAPDATSWTWQPASHIGGVGLMRVQSFTRRAAIPSRGRFGFTEWQDIHLPARGWITPDLPVLELDRLPFEPWRSLAARYVKLGWSRRWPEYEPRDPWWWEWFVRSGAGRRAAKQRRRLAA